MLVPGNPPFREQHFADIGLPDRVALASAAIFGGFRQRLRFGPRIADGLCQHLAQLSLGLRGLSLDGRLPLCHRPHMGTTEGKFKPNGLPAGNRRTFARGRWLATNGGVRVY